MGAVADIDEVRNSNGRIPMKAFAELRDQCPALREVLLPDAIWQQFQDWHDLPDEVASHRSILLLAFRRGSLPRVTEPIHQYLLSSITGARPSVRSQYLRDLQERWMFDNDPVKRNSISRIFRGRLVELQYASWLERRAHTVVGLEALREGPDIETLSGHGTANAFEVKAIGVEDGDFRIFVESLSGGAASTWVSPYTAINYLLFRVYEAACQLRGKAGLKSVIVVIDEITWFRFDTQLENNWIDWKNAALFPADEDWQQFLDGQAKRYPNLCNDLDSTVRTLDSIKVLKQDSRFEFLPAYDLHPKM